MNGHRGFPIKPDKTHPNVQNKIRKSKINSGKSRFPKLQTHLKMKMASKRILIYQSMIPSPSLVPPHLI